jgi:hypothetical protein
MFANNKQVQLTALPKLIYLLSSILTELITHIMILLII